MARSAAARKQPQPAPQEKFSWAGGANPPVDAHVFKATWDALSTKLGRPALAEDLVEAAKVRGHVLHDCFNWDLREAALAHWIATANNLIMSLRVTFIGGESRTITIRALVSVREPAGRTIVTSRDALDTADWRRQILERALEELRVFGQKYANLLIAADAVDRADALAQALTALLDAEAARGW
jgi:hypothetical protein